MSCQSVCVMTDDDCPICLDTMTPPFALRQCKHRFHAPCVLKSMDVYLANYGTEWQTVPCPICKQRISYHCILEDCIRKCHVDDVKQIVHPRNLFTECHLGHSLVHIAAAAGKLETVQYLVQQGLPPDTFNTFGLTPAYLAAVGGHTKVVQYLVENHRANIHCESMFGATMLNAAIEYRHHDMVEYLKQKGARLGSDNKVDFKHIETNSLLVKAIQRLL